MTDANAPESDQHSDDLCDVVVIGLGPGGEAVAANLARAGLDVVGIDERLVGGECPYFGCIPSKMAIRAADALAEARRVREFAGSARVDPDWRQVFTRIRDEATTDWDDQVAVDRLTEAGARFVRGHGRLTGPRTVSVGDRVLRARRGVVLNPGTRPMLPPIPGLAGTDAWTNREIFHVETLPASLAVIGGGPIGAELAQALHRFGVRVTLLEVGDRILGPLEPESSAVIAEAFAAEGIEVLTGVRIDAVARDDAGFSVTLADREVRAERLLVAAGRISNLDDLGLETVGLDPSARSVGVDAWMRAGDGLWVVGDVAGHGAFTHLSMYHSDVVTRDILGQGGPAADHRAVPHVTFTDPEVAGVGLTERQAVEAGLRVRVATTDLAASTRGWIAKASGVVKLVADADRGVLVGANVAGPAAGEIVSMLVTAVHAEVPVERLRSMIYAYPTFHRSIESAVRDLTAVEPD